MSVILLYNFVIKSSNVVQSAEFFRTLGRESPSSPFLMQFSRGRLQIPANSKFNILNICEIFNINLNYKYVNFYENF